MYSCDWKEQPTIHTICMHVYVRMQYRVWYLQRSAYLNYLVCVIRSVTYDVCICFFEMCVNVRITC